MILIREMTPPAIERVTVAPGISTPSIRNMHLHVPALGVPVDIGGFLLDCLGDDRVHELDDRRVRVGAIPKRGPRPPALAPRPRRPPRYG